MSQAAASNAQPVTLWELWGIRVPVIVAAALATVLLRQALGGAALAGCGQGQGGCATVLASRWAYWFNLPVSGVALGVYGLTLLGTLLVQRAEDEAARRGAWRLLLALACAITVAALWFITLQAAVLKAWCVYCTVAHVAGLAGAWVIFLRCPLPGRTGLLPGAATGVVLVFGQFMSLPAASTVVRTAGSAVVDPQRRVSVLGDRVRLKPGDYPMLGDPSARHVLVHLFDYTCTHCRAVHTMLEEAVRRSDGALGVVMLPVPMDAHCNKLVSSTAANREGACEYALLALAVFHADPGQFRAFDAAMFKEERLPSVEQARAIAGQLVGEAALEASLASAWVRAQIERYVYVYVQSGQTVLPLVIGPSWIIAGRPGTTQELLAQLEKESGVEFSR